MIELELMRKKIDEIDDKLLAFFKERLEVSKKIGLLKKKYKMEIFSESAGYIKRIKTEKIGKAAMIIGAGRAKKGDEIDHSAGINIFKKAGEKIAKNEKIAEIYYNDNKNITESQNMVLEAFELTKEKVEKPEAILEIIE